MAKLIIGCGYLGRRVAALWRAQGHHVIATTRSSHKAEELRRLGVEPRLCEVLDPDNLTALPGADTVLHCVALDRTTGRSLRDLYVGGLSNMMARLPKPRRFLYVGSTSVYAQTDGGEVDESSPAKPAEESGRVALEAEGALRYWLPDAVVLRFAGIYGPGRLMRSQSRLKGEPIPADPDGWLNLIHVEDGAAAVVAADERARPGETYNIADDRPVRRREFYGRLAELLGAPPPRFVPPAQPDAANRRVSNRKMRAELGVAPRYPSFEEGLRASV